MIASSYDMLHGKMSLFKLLQLSHFMRISNSIPLSLLNSVPKNVSFFPLVSPACDLHIFSQHFPSLRMSA